MNKLFYILSALLLLTGCSLQKDNNLSQTNKDNEKATSEQLSSSNTTNNEGDKTAITDTNNLFTPPHFTLKNFNIQKTKSGDIKFIVNYLLDANAVNYLHDHPTTVYFTISYPKEIQNSSNKTASKDIKVNMSDDSLLSKQIVITDKFNNQSVLTQLDNPKLDFDLQVFDEKKKLFFEFDDLNIYRNNKEIK